MLTYLKYSVSFSDIGKGSFSDKAINSAAVHFVSKLSRFVYLKHLFPSNKNSAGFAVAVWNYRLNYKF